MSDNGTKKAYNMSWGMIILWILFFFPVAIYFSLRKRNAIKDIDYYIKECNGYMILGAIMVVFALPTLTDLENDPQFWTTLTISLGMLVIGLVLLLYNFKSKSLYREFIQYIRILKNDESGTISNIADAIGKTPQHTIEDLEKMIKKSILTDTYIDYSMRRLVGPIVGANVVRRSNKKTKLEPIAERIVMCSGCGAKNRLVRAGQTCSYCDSPLE